ncbi:phage replisome organizer N-terminal domain-containing protein [Priestia megaterium]|uniref:phage replisome organizer N-terminal domain-containing protein n=1 Tax=Priestia megaterium TaxID=1404 RepID=UPI001363F66A|nr:phage replisome organizer N-terminal domain-containing protein [Priestia megaterium]
MSSSVKWIKLSTQMFEDEKIRLIESMPEADTILIIWVKLLAQAGKTNASGYIYLAENIPFTDEMLATIFNRSLPTVRLALRTLEQFGMIEINDDHTICISNWEKHQNVEGLEKIREQNRLRKQKERERKKLLETSQDSHVTVTQNHATDIDKEKELEEEKEKKKKTSPKYETCDITLAELLYNLILKRDPKFKKPNLEKWANDIRLMRERDERTPEQIEYLINWSQENSFWCSNILSASKLRSKATTLILQIKGEKDKKQNGGNPNERVQSSNRSGNTSEYNNFSL